MDRPDWHSVAALLRELAAALDRGAVVLEAMDLEERGDADAPAVPGPVCDEGAN